jgi:hypothetical protein
MSEAMTREDILKQELKARRHLKKLKANREKALLTAHDNVHKKYNKLEESYIAQLHPEVAKQLRVEEEAVTPEQIDGDVGAEG